MTEDSEANTRIEREFTAWANGYTGRNFRDHRTSTVDIGGILSNVANKFLLDGFFSVERTWRNVCAVKTPTT